MIMRSPKELGMIAACRRKQLGLTQSAVGDLVGLKQKTVSAFENNPESVMLVTAFLILSALHLDLNTSEKGKAKASQWDQEW